MLGWMLVFALISLFGFISTVSGRVEGTVGMFTSLVFAVLFFACLLTRAVRGRP